MIQNRMQICNNSFYIFPWQQRRTQYLKAALKGQRRDIFTKALPLVLFAFLKPFRILCNYNSQGYSNSMPDTAVWQPLRDRPFSSGKSRLKAYMLYILLGQYCPLYTQLSYVVPLKDWVQTTQNPFNVFFCNKTNLNSKHDTQKLGNKIQNFLHIVF